VNDSPRQKALSAITRLITEELRLELVLQGFQPYRIDELLNTDTGRHVRYGYAGGEWRVTVSQLYRYNYREIEVIVLDSRRYADKLVPTVAELVGRIVSA